MNTIDKGLKKALSQQPDYRLPSNFSYRMMQKIHQETLLREKRQEKDCSFLCSSLPFWRSEVAWDFCAGNTEINSSPCYKPCKKIVLPCRRVCFICLFSVPSSCSFCSTDGCGENSSHTLKEAVQRRVSKLKIVFTHTQKILLCPSFI